MPESFDFSDLLAADTLSILIAFGLKVIGFVLLVVVARIVAGWLGGFVKKRMRKAKVDETLTKFAGKMIYVTILVLAIIAGLGIFGIETASFAAVLAGAGLAIGLALQGTLSNFSAGVMLLLFRPFKVGDVISVGGSTGKVDEIELFTTTLDTPDNRRLIVPNGSVFGATIENVTYHPTRRVAVDVGTGYSEDLDAVRRTLEATAKSLDGVLPEPAPQVYLLQLGGSSIDWSVRVWANTADYWAIREKLTHAIKRDLDAAGIEIPFPQMDVHLDRG